MSKRSAHSCKVFVINFGQWDAGWPEAQLTKTEDYGRKVEAFIRDALFMVSDDSSRLIWMTTNPHPMPWALLR